VQRLLVTTVGEQLGMGQPAVDRVQVDRRAANDGQPAIDPGGGRMAEGLSSSSGVMLYSRPHVRL